MATTTTSKLELTFLDSEGLSMKHSYNYADPNVDGDDVSTLASTTITNGSIFKKVPVTFKSAQIVQTSKTDISIV